MSTFVEFSSRVRFSVGWVPAWREFLRTMGSEAAMDFGDSPEEAAFRIRLREWLPDNNPRLPNSSTDDDYWAGQRAWHQSLYDGGFFGTTWSKEIGGQGLSSVYDVIVDEELAAAGAPPRPSLGYLVEGILEHGSDDTKRRFLPGIVNGRDRWCQGFSEPDAGSDLASLRTRAELRGDKYILTGHKIWTSYSDDADWCLVLARTDLEVAKHKGISAFAVPMRQPGIEQRPLPMINGITKEFGEVLFDGARVPADNMIGKPGEGWRLAMTVVSHEREPQQLGFAGRYKKLVGDLTERVRREPLQYDADQLRDLGWAIVEADMLRFHVSRRLSERIDGVTHGPEGSIDKLLMTWTEQAVGHAALSVGGIGPAADDTWLKVYLYGRAQSVMGGTSQIQRNLVAERILRLPVS
jgi:alkylation response protein AidB-like acyl-CoA dehydrogenase